MSLKGSIQRWIYWQQMAKIDRHCAKHGHNDFGCYSVTGSVGELCGHCGRILWKRRDGTTEYQKPSRRSDSNWR